MRQQQQQRQLRDFEVMPAERYLDGNVPMLTKMLARRLYIVTAFSASSAVARLSRTLIWTAEYMWTGYSIYSCCLFSLSLRLALPSLLHRGQGALLPKLPLSSTQCVPVYQLSLIISKRHRRVSLRHFNGGESRENIYRNDDIPGCIISRGSIKSLDFPKKMLTHFYTRIKYNALRP